MALQRSRKRISVKGLGTMAIRQVEPVSAMDFEDAGYLGSTVLNDTMTAEEIFGEDGCLQDVKIRSQAVTVETMLEQSGADEIGLLRQSADRVHAVRYYGAPAPNRFQYFCFDCVRLNPALQLDFRNGARQVPLKFWALAQDERQFAVPLYTMVETAGELTVDGLQLWVAPRLGLNLLAPQLLDISGFGRHGAIAGYESISDVWRQDSSGMPFVHFGEGGRPTVISFGDVPQIDGAHDLVMEAWIRIEAGDGAECRLFGKRAASSPEEPERGYMVFRDAANKLRFWSTDGAGIVSLTSAQSITVAGGWTHCAVVVDMDGDSRLYINGVPDGDAAPTTAADCSNSEPFLLGANAADYGNFSCGDLRVHTFTAGRLPSDIGGVIQRHYMAERHLYQGGD